MPQLSLLVQLSISNVVITLSSTKSSPHRNGPIKSASRLGFVALLRGSAAVRGRGELVIKHTNKFDSNSAHGRRMYDGSRTTTNGQRRQADDNNDADDADTTATTTTTANTTPPTGGRQQADDGKQTTSRRTGGQTDRRTNELLSGRYIQCCLLFSCRFVFRRFVYQPPL